MPEEQNSQNPNSQAQQSGQPVPSPAGASNTVTPPQEQTVPYARFKEINDRLKAMEDEQTKQAAERQAADEKRMAEQAEWQKLAETHKGTLEKLQPRIATLDKLTEMVLAQYQDEVKEWPEQVRAMAPADEADILIKLDWLKRAKPLALELMNDKTPVPGNGGRPKPAAPAGQRHEPIENAVNVRRAF